MLFGDNNSRKERDCEYSASYMPDIYFACYVRPSHSFKKGALEGEWQSELTGFMETERGDGRAG